MGKNRFSLNIDSLNPWQFVTALFGLVSILFFLYWSKLPTEDARTYFDFADNRCLLGIDNFSDVVSNLAFTFVGFFGFYQIRRNHALSAEYKYIGFSLAFSMLLVSLGSAYFHYQPNVERLFWDRVPMVLGFISIISLLIADRVDKKMGLKILFYLIGLSAITLTLWRLNYLNLRSYLFIQFGGLVYIAFISLLKPRGLIPNLVIGKAFALYILAKVFENQDLFFYKNTGLISGHTLKHLISAAAMYVLFVAFKKIQTAVISS